MIPVYRNFDPHHIKYVKQSIHNFFFTGSIFILFWGYYQFHPPEAGIDRIVSTLSYIITSASILSVFLSGSYFQFRKNSG